MFPTQFTFLKQEKHQTFSKQKQTISFSLLDTFYQNLVDQSIRPQLLDFFLLQDKIDIKQKFDKYEQQQIISHQDQESTQNNNNATNLIQSLIKKDIVFNLPNTNSESNANRIMQGPNGSKISYFVISQSLKNATLNTHNISKKSIQTKRQQKESLQNLHQFIFQDQAVFFLLKGNLQIHKKIQINNLKQKKSSPSNTQLYRTRKNNHQHIHQSNDIIKQSIRNSVETKSNIERQPQNHLLYGKQSKDIPKEWKKYFQVKQHSFFCLNNYKILNHQTLQQQNLKLVPKTSCILAKILVNPKYGNEYLETKNSKFSLISSFISSKKQHDPQKLQHLKSIVDCFQQEKIRREMTISFEGRKNQKIYIIQDDGQIQFSKNVYFNENENAEGLKKLQIFNFRGKTIINGQSYLNNSKNLLNILRSNSFLKQSQKIERNKNQNQQFQGFDRNKKYHSQVQHQFNRKQIIDLQNLIIPGKKQEKILHPPLNPNGKIHFGESQQAFLQFYLPKLNQSNFTIKINSAFITVYSIEKQKFQQIASQKMKKNLAKNYELIYITLLRKSLQRLELFKKKISAGYIKKNEEMKNYVALQSVKQTERFSPELKNQNNINVSVTKLEFQHKKEYKGLKRNDLVFKQGETMEKRIQILDYNDKSKKDKNVMTDKFKKKIENLIIQNLNDIKNMNTSRAKENQKDKNSAQLNQFFIGNIDQILSTERFKNEKYMKALNKKSSSTVQRQMKKSISARQVVQKDMYVDPSVFDPSKNKSIKISLMRKGHPCVKQNNNFLKGVQIQGYTDAIKSNIAVKINETNKIKEQFIKVQSKCESCRCYDDLDSYRNLSSYNSARPGTSQQRCSTHDIKYHTMKIGVNWKTKYSQFNNKIESKTAYDPKSLQNKMQKMAQDDQPFERVYNRIKVLKQKSLQKFNFNQYLLRKGKDVKSRNQRKKSLPLLL